jgi:RNA polymerase sigma factor (sigma-70 family)
MMVDVPDDSISQILDQYHPLVMHIAKRACCSSSTLDINDLCQVGDMAVLRAVKSYDPASGCNIKSFVASAIRNSIFNEAARFLGVMTVDFRTTNQASYAAKLFDKGKNDQEIAAALTKKYGRNFDAEHARDLRITYSHRQYQPIHSEITVNIENDISIKDLLESVVRDDFDKAILEKRIFGNDTVAQLAIHLNTSKKAVYEREASLKSRIKRAIEEAV